MASARPGSYWAGPGGRATKNRKKLEVRRRQRGGGGEKQKSSPRDFMALATQQQLAKQTNNSLERSALSTSIHLFEIHATKQSPFLKEKSSTAKNSQERSKNRREKNTKNPQNRPRRALDTDFIDPKGFFQSIRKSQVSQPTGSEDRCCKIDEVTRYFRENGRGKKTCPTKRAVTSSRVGQVREVKGRRKKKGCGKRLDSPNSCVLFAPIPCGTFETDTKQRGIILKHILNTSKIELGS